MAAGNKKESKKGEENMTRGQESEAGEPRKIAAAMVVGEGGKGGGGPGRPHSFCWYFRHVAAATGGGGTCVHAGGGAGEPVAWGGGCCVFPRVWSWGRDGGWLPIAVVRDLHLLLLSSSLFLAWMDPWTVPKSFFPDSFLWSLWCS
jgi:hypothetical protein